MAGNCCFHLCLDRNKYLISTTVKLDRIGMAMIDFVLSNLIPNLKQRNTMLH